MLKMAKLFLLVAVLGLLVFGCSENQNPLISDNSPQTVLKENSGLSLADGALESATLHLYVHLASNNVVNVHRIYNPWMEYYVTWNNFGGAYTPEIYGSFTSDVIGWHEVDITDLVAGWMNGTFENHGLLLAQMDHAYPWTVINSRENPMNQPYLEICYTGESVCKDTIAIADAYINEFNPDERHGSHEYLMVGWVDATGKEKQSLLKFHFEPGETEEGCSLTIGYWKNHAGLGEGNQADMVSGLLPIWLGDAGGSKSIDVTTNVIAVEILSQHVYGDPDNGITKLYAQLLGAKLNILNGAGYMVIADIIDDADEFLADYDWTDWEALVEAESDWVDYVKDWHDTLDEYNNGDIGPGHCEDEEEDEMERLTD